MKKLLLVCLLAGVAVAGDLKSCMQALENDQFIVAAECFETEANSGNQIAQYNLAVMYNNGFGVEKNKDEATKLTDIAMKNN